MIGLAKAGWMKSECAQRGDRVTLQTEAVKAAVTMVKDLLDRAERGQGIVHMANPARVGSNEGFIVWDYLIYNEVYFIANDPKMRIQSFVRTASDATAQQAFDEQVNRYGI